MKQYLDLLQNIIDNGVEKESGRANMANTIGISNGIIRMNLQDGFPLLTTKKMYLKGVIHELLWFLRGDTNIKYLVDNNVNIWNDDAYRWYLTLLNKRQKELEGSSIELVKLTQDEFINCVKNFDSIYEDKIKYMIYSHHPDEFQPVLSMLSHLFEYEYRLGDLGKVYGYQWRNQNGVDQVKEVLDNLKNNPYSRYHIIDGWNKADFNEMALPPCHLLYQFIVRPLSFKERRDLAHKYAIDNNLFPLAIDAFGNKGIPEYMNTIDETGWNIPKFYLDLNMYQRSCDTALGVPFNIASMSLLLMLFAKVNNMIPGVSTWIGGDTHLYVNHIENIKEQINREPFKLPSLNINKEIKNLEDILNLTINDFELVGYESHPAIKFELFTGLKK
jgi:thymidylate synthase